MIKTPTAFATTMLRRRPDPLASAVDVLRRLDPATREVARIRIPALPGATTPRARGGRVSRSRYR